MKIGCFLETIPIGTMPGSPNGSSSSASGTLRYVTRQTLLRECLEMCDQYEISALPVVDSLETRRVVAIYHRSDVSFIMKASDPEAVMHNLRTFRVEDSLAIRDQMLATGEISLTSLTQNLVTVKIHDPVSQVFKALVLGRSHRAVIVDEQGALRGVVSYRDFIKYFLETYLSR
jgi:CBS domain-containing protein